MSVTNLRRAGRSGAWARRGPPPLPGLPSAYGVWVSGDGSGNNVNIPHFLDATGQTFQVNGPAIDWIGWRFLSFPLRVRRPLFVVFLTGAARMTGRFTIPSAYRPCCCWTRDRNTAPASGNDCVEAADGHLCGLACPCAPLRQAGVLAGGFPAGYNGIIAGDVPHRRRRELPHGLEVTQGQTPGEDAAGRSQRGGVPPHRSWRTRRPRRTRSCCRKRLPPSLPCLSRSVRLSNRAMRLLSKSRRPPARDGAPGSRKCRRLLRTPGTSLPLPPSRSHRHRPWRTPTPSPCRRLRLPSRSSRRWISARPSLRPIRRRPQRRRTRKNRHPKTPWPRWASRRTGGMGAT